MSARSPSPIQKGLLDRLPRERRDELILIGRKGLGLFGCGHFQRVFEEHLEAFEYLAAQGATATMIGELLAAVGIAREDGTALPAGTVSSALSRARRDRALRASHPPAVACMLLQAPAGPGNALQHRVGNPGAAGQARAGPALSASSAPGLTRSLPRIRPSPNASAGTGLPTATRRAAALLEQLRSKNDENDES
jgi:hypothetical protein